MNSRITKISALRGSSAMFAMALMSVMGTSAHSQTHDAWSEGDEIIVTGSRIARPMLDAPNPITVQTAQDLFRTGQLNVGDTLSQLPSLAPSYTQASSQGGGLSIGTSGLDILDLRGLGIEHTLVLVDGKRHITSLEGAFAVDVNSIPNDLIDRVDIVTGGSSAVYGSDAIAGVVNFVMKQNFEGAALNAQGGISSHADRGTYKLSGTFGKNFAEGRGNIALAVEYDRFDPLYYTDRPDLTGGANGRNQFQLVNAPGSGLPERTFQTGLHSFNYSNGGSFIAYYGGNPANCAPVGGCDSNGLSRIYQFQPNGELTETNYGTDYRALGSGNNQGGDGATGRDSGTLDPGYSRYVANLMGHYDVSDGFRPYFDAKFSRVLSTMQGTPTFASGGLQIPLPAGVGPNVNDPNSILISLDNAFLTQQARDLISSYLAPGADTFRLNRYNVDLGARAERDRRDTYRLVVGAKGTFNTDWNYDVSADYGVLRTKYAFLNNRIEQNFYNAIDAVFNSAGDIVCRINQVTITDPSCHPIDILGTGGTAQTAAQRQAALNYFNTTSYRWGQATELDLNASIQGNTSRFFTLPGGPVRFAVGAEYRRETASYHYDDLVTSGATYLGTYAPFNPPAFAVKEAFGEVDLPILKDQPFIKELSLSGAGRYADYKGSTGSVWAYNGAAVYAPVQDVRFRASFSHSVRAPTLYDQYAPTSLTGSLLSYDPCDAAFINSGSLTRAANCAAAGVPANFVNSFVRSNGGVYVTQQGNPDLKAETSQNWTYGVTIQPRPIPGLTVSVDYYNITINNVITQVSAQNIVNGCYDAATLNNQFCSLILPRNPDGSFQQPALVQTWLNYSAERAKGIDLDIAYSHRFNVDNRIGLRFIGNYVRQRADYTDAANPSVPNQIKGELGTPIYKFNFEADYTYKKLTLGYTLRYIGKQSIADWEIQHAVAGESSTPYDPLYADVIYYPKVIYHDIAFSLDVTEKLNFYGGVRNLTDKMPPYGLLGNGGTSSDFATGNDGIYDNIGRYMYMGVRVKI